MHPAPNPQKRLLAHIHARFATSDPQLVRGSKTLRFQLEPKSRAPNQLTQLPQKLVGLQVEKVLQYYSSDIGGNRLNSEHRCLSCLKSGPGVKWVILACGHYMHYSCFRDDRRRRCSQCRAAHPDRIYNQGGVVELLVKYSQYNVRCVNDRQVQKLMSFVARATRAAGEVFIIII